MTRYIKTNPSPLVAGQPGVVYWEPVPGAVAYRMIAGRSPIGLEIASPADPYPGLTSPRDSLVRVLSRAETATWLDPTSPKAPYVLLVYAVNSQFYNQVFAESVNGITVQPLAANAPAAP
jgi:hypothetical protein